MMFPGQHEARPRAAAAVPVAAPLPRASAHGERDGTPSTRPQPRELSGGLQVVVFAAVLLTATWLMLWVAAMAR